MTYPQLRDGRFGITLPDGGFYPHSFTLADLEDFEIFVGQHPRQMWYFEVAHEGVADTNAIAIRHDVDHSIEHAHRFAKWEYDHGIVSTYFILPTALYFRRNASDTIEACLEMQEMGHEIGIHNDALTYAARSTAPGENASDRAMLFLREWVDWFRIRGLRIHGCADHGGGEPRNVDLWREPYSRTPEEAGLGYEAYALHALGANYISDNRGGWRAPLAQIPGKQTHVLIHPCHWHVP